MDTPCSNNSVRHVELPASAATWSGVWCCCCVATFKFTPTPWSCIKQSTFWKKSKNNKVVDNFALP